MAWDSRGEVRRAVFAEIKETETKEAFGELKQKHEPLRCHETVQDLLGLLNGPSNEAIKEKNEVLHALIVAANTPGVLAAKAKLLLLAGLWNALDGSFFRLRPFLHGTDDPFAEVYWAFLEELKRWDPNERDYVAFRLQQRVERRVRRAVSRTRRAESARQQAIDTAIPIGSNGLVALAAQASGAPLSAHFPSLFSVIAFSDAFPRSSTVYQKKRSSLSKKPDQR